MLNDDNVDQNIRDFVRTQKDIEIDRYSSEGGNCEMYFGKRIVLGDRVALKFYFSSTKIESHAEPRILMSINHANILRVYDAKIISSYYSYFLTPEICGGDLKKHIDSNIIDTATALSIISDILTGLNILHCKPHYLVHRDLKPKNILFDSQANKAIISDFGSVKVMDNVAGKVTGSKATHIYRPKEAVLHDQYTFQSDLYQVGIILFQLLAGRFPDAAINWLNAKQQKKLEAIVGDFERWKYIESILDKLIVTNNLLDFNSLPVFISEKLRRVIRKATHPDLSKRYKTASEFLNDIYKAQKKLINWWEENDIIHAKKDGNREYRIYSHKGANILEKMTIVGAWNKRNNHDGGLSSIINFIEND